MSHQAFGLCVVAMGLAVAAAASADDTGLRLELPGLDQRAQSGSQSAAVTDAAGAPKAALTEAPSFNSDLPISAGTNFYFRIAGWYTALDANLAYGDSVNLGVVDLDFERTLNYDLDLLTMRGEFGFTIAKRFHLDFAANGPFNYDGNTSQTISFRDYSFAGNAHTELDFVTLEADFSYDVISKDRFRLWVTGGVRGMLMHFEVSGQATDSGGNFVGSRDDDIDAIAALPVLGLGARWDVSRNFYLSAKGVGFYAGQYGNSYDLMAEAGWDFTRHFGIFAGFKYQHLEVDEVSIDDYDLSFDSSLYGPYAGVAVRF